MMDLNNVSIIENMLQDYPIKRISINGDIYSGSLIKFFEFHGDYVYVEFEHDGILIAPKQRLDYLIIDNEYDEDDE